MSNPVPSIPIDLDRRRFVKIDLNSMCEFERLMRKPFLEYDVKSMNDFRTMFWLALRQDDPEITIEYAGSLISLGGVPAANQAMTQALELAMPESTETEEAAPKNESSSTGSNSGPSGIMISD